MYYSRLYLEYAWKRTSSSFPTYRWRSSFLIKQNSNWHFYWNTFDPSKPYYTIHEHKAKTKAISPLNVQLGPWYRDWEKTFKNKQASFRKRRLVISLNDINGWNWLLICMWSHFNGNNSFHIIPQMRLVDMIAFFSPIKIV